MVELQNFLNAPRIAKKISNARGGHVPTCPLTGDATGRRTRRLALDIPGQTTDLTDDDVRLQSVEEPVGQARRWSLYGRGVQGDVKPTHSLTHSLSWPSRLQISSVMTAMLLDVRMERIDREIFNLDNICEQSDFVDFFCVLFFLVQLHCVCVLL